MDTPKIATRISVILEFIMFITAAIFTIAWLLDVPLFYRKTGPVLSMFTSISILLTVGVRMARRYLFGWPQPLTFAILVIVLGGNFTSLMMVTSLPPNFTKAFDLVFTSSVTSTGLILFCTYELLINLRKTPGSPFIVDDMILHLALLPVALSLLSYVFHQPDYTTSPVDPRIGVTFLEMTLLSLYTINAVLTNHDLFLWQFLASSWSNRITFALLITNQFAVPFLVGWIFPQSGELMGMVGLEIYVMIAGAIATLLFLFIQAYLHQTHDTATS